MVSPQATQPDKPSYPTGWHITDEIRRQVLAEHYATRLVQQRSAVESERADRKALGPQELVFSTADLRYSNKCAVRQDIAACLAAYSDNRDFVGQVNQ